MTYIRVPEGMSCVNAFYALWSNSTPTNPAQADEVSTAEKVAQLFTETLYFDYKGGSLVKTNFSEFPRIEISLYDRAYGQGAAQRIIETYNGVASEDRFDRGDRYSFRDQVKILQSLSIFIH